jgi:predicted class III extradiol MEMO1 family dioxygenase
MNNKWFDSKHIVLDNIIKLNNIHGYVLPHASTKYTGHIISHTNNVHFKL